MTTYPLRTLCHIGKWNAPFETGRENYWKQEKMKSIHTLVIAGILLASCTSFALAADKKATKHTDPYVGGPATEDKLSREIRHNLVMLPYFGVFDDLGFTVDQEGHVTLVGEVTRPTLKSDAENTVKRIEGVQSVVNQIEVLPLSGNDDRIRRAVYQAIYGDAALSTRYGFRALPSIHIIVKNGNVRLEGLVANEGDRTIANLRANGVPGVFSVENQLQVEGK